MKIYVLFFFFLSFVSSTNMKGCSKNKCADCHFENVCENAGCVWDNSVPPNGPIPWCTPKPLPYPKNAYVCSQSNPCHGQTFTQNNLTLICKDDHVCDYVHVKCSQNSNCTIDAKGSVYKMIIDARAVGSKHKVEIKCNHHCTNIKIKCPNAKKSECVCKDCSKENIMECYHGGGICKTSQAKIIPKWTGNNVWCKTHKIYPNIPFHLMPGYCPSIDYIPYPCQMFYEFYNGRNLKYAPNKYCAAFNFTYYNHHTKSMENVIELASCAKILNETTLDAIYTTPQCVEYLQGGPKRQTTPPCKQDSIVLNNSFFKNNTKEDDFREKPLFETIQDIVQEYLLLILLILVFTIVSCCFWKCCCQKFCCKDKECCTMCNCEICVEKIMKKMGYGDVYENIMKAMEWIECCCCVGEREEEDTPVRSISRQFTNNLDIEAVEEYEIPTKTDSPVRLRRVCI